MIKINNHILIFKIPLLGNLFLKIIKRKMKKLKFIFYSILLTIILIGCESKPEETNTTTDTIKVEKSSTVIKDSISTNDSIIK